MLKRNKRGFTLIEVMIVVAIVSILVGIAYPSYVEHIQRSRRSECTTVMVSVANMLERRYSTTAPATYVAAPPIPAALTACPSQGGGGVYYNIAPTVLTATTFTIQATPTISQAGDKCGSLTLTHAGVKGVIGAKPGVTAEQCW
ncbi:MAG: type IV pilin protein [Rhodocyclales bacterium]|nr:type IV pilin protein [Rhodocyclales bacterium]